MVIIKSYNRTVTIAEENEAGRLVPGVTFGYVPIQISFCDIHCGLFTVNIVKPIKLYDKSVGKTKTFHSVRRILEGLHHMGKLFIYIVFAMI